MRILTKNMTIGIEQQLILKKLYEKGFSMRTIAKQENISSRTVKKYLLIQGIKVQTQNIIRKLKSDNQLLIGLYCGVWAGDGTQYYDEGYRIKICLHSGNQELVLFIQHILMELFGKKTLFVHDHGEFSGFIRFKSKFIYYFVKKYLNYEEYKTKTIGLKKSIEEYPNNFIDGFFLGLMLSDGCLKRIFSYNTISWRLAVQVKEMLIQFGFQPKIYTHKREKYGWNDLYMVQLNKKESRLAQEKLNQILEKINYCKGFTYLKG